MGGWPGHVGWLIDGRQDMWTGGWAGGWGTWVDVGRRGMWRAVSKAMHAN